MNTGAQLKPGARQGPLFSAAQFWGGLLRSKRFVVTALLLSPPSMRFQSLPRGTAMAESLVVSHKEHSQHTFRLQTSLPAPQSREKPPLTAPPDPQRTSTAWAR